MNIKRIGIIILAVAALTTGCAENECDYCTDGDLVFKPVVSIMTRNTDLYSSIYPTDTPFGVWGFSLPKEKGWKDNNGTACEIYGNEEVPYSSSGWIPDKMETVISGNDRLSFFAYSPYEKTAGFSKTEGITFKDFDVNKDNTDIMFGGPLYDISPFASKGIVNIPFTRALCAVDFYAYTSMPSNDTIIINKLEIKDVVYKGSFKMLPSPAWEISDEKEDLVFFEGNTKLSSIPIHIGNTHILMPQDLAGEVTLTCTMEVNGICIPGQIFTAEKSMSWGIGKHAIYYLNVTENTKFATDWNIL
ncbi:MAG: fimbrillin family protein [Bacteroidales bacterium]|jgi:hypothetical protein|nr:fimbrillin family protein [Bacteroidales bacterium]